MLIYERVQKYVETWAPKPLSSNQNETSVKNVWLISHHVCVCVCWWNLWFLCSCCNYGKPHFGQMKYGRKTGQIHDSKGWKLPFFQWGLSAFFWGKPNSHALESHIRIPNAMKISSPNPRLETWIQHVGGSWGCLWYLGLKKRRYQFYPQRH